jgi:hypothetical protein
MNESAPKPSDLSPAAQAVMNAYYMTLDHEGPRVYDTLLIAAAISAVADLVVPPAVMLEYYERNESPVLGKAIEIRSKLLAIVTELEGRNG